MDLALFAQSKPDYLSVLALADKSFANSADSLIVGDFVEQEAPIPVGSRHTELLRIATLICTELSTTADIHEFKYKVFKYDANYCKPPLQNNSRDKQELERIVSDVWEKFERYRGSAEEVEEKVLESPEVKKSIQESIDELNEEFSYILKMKKIWRFKQQDFISPQDFLVQTSNRRLEVQLKKTTKLIHLGQKWIESKNRKENRDVVFKPGGASEIDGCINLWQGWGAEPVRSKECERIFNEFLDYIFKGEQNAREWFVQWLAYPIQHPGTKLFCAVLLWGIQGSGKTLMGEIIGRIYGLNYINIDASVLTHPFDGWKKHMQFVCGDEICTQDNKRRHNDTLKHLITGNTLHINEKYQPLVIIKNCANFLFTSNHQNAIAIEQTERRFFVWKMPKVIDEPLLKKVVREVLTRRGADALMHYFLNEVDTTNFDPTGMPYRTEALNEMVNTTRSDLESYLEELKIYGIDGCQLKSEIVTLTDLKICYELSNTKTTIPAIKNALYRIGVSADIKREIKIKSAHGVRNTYLLFPITRLDYWLDQNINAWRDEYFKIK